MEKVNTTSQFLEVTEEMAKNIKHGDELYYMSSWGMQKCVYPNIKKIETHSLLWGDGKPEPLTSYFVKNPNYNEDDYWKKIDEWDADMRKKLNQ